MISPTQEKTCQEIHNYVKNVIFNFKEIDPFFENRNSLIYLLQKYSHNLASENKILFEPSVSLENINENWVVRLYDPATSKKIDAVDKIISPLAGVDL